MMGLRAIVGFLLLLCGCASWNPVTIAHDMGVSGWFRVDPQGRWQPFELTAAECSALGSETVEADHEPIVIVPGVKGDGPEITPLVPLLQTAGRPLFLFRWVPWEERDPLAARFASGLSKLLACAPAYDGRLLVLAHSAGGVVASYAAGSLVLPVRDRVGPALYLMTVASPLAGTSERARNSDGRAEARFMLDLGSDITRYPTPPTALAAVHLRTQYPGDQVMKPKGTHLPNDPAVGLAGARQVDLPPELTHDGSVEWVAHRIAEGSWRAWFPGP